MKAKLIKKDDNYFLEVEYWYPKYIRPTIVANTFVKPKGDVYDLSKQNCDEIFGIIDVEKLAKEVLPNDDTTGTLSKQKGFVIGFNKAMELNKDKMFTLENIDKAIEWGIVNGRKGDVTHYDIDNFIQSIQQPTEIDVEIEMDDIWDGIDSARILPKEETSIPMLDKDGCLILKRAK